MKALEGPSLTPAGGGAPQHLVVCLHGFGANGHDLIGLARNWAPLLPNAAFLSPHAPHSCPMVPGGRQWFDLTMKDRDEYWHGVTQVAPIVDAYLDMQLEAYGLAEDKLALVGFSQGAMMALHIAPRRPHAMAAVVGYSGLLAGPQHLPRDIRSRPPVVLAHGDRDDVIPIAEMFAAAQALAQSDIGVEFHTGQGVGHGIGPDGLELGGQFLRACLKQA